MLDHYCPRILVLLDHNLSPDLGVELVGMIQYWTHPLDMDDRALRCNVASVLDSNEIN